MSPEREGGGTRERAGSYPLDHALVVSNLTAESRDVSARRALDVGFSSLMLSFDARFKPERVVLICDHHELELAYRLEALLVSHAIDVSVWGVSMSRVDEATHTITRHLSEWGSPLPLCVSGRHALLDSIAVAVFAMERSPILCVRHGVLYRIGARASHTRLAPRLRVDDLLASLGGRLSRGYRGGWFEPHLSTLSLSLLHTRSGEIPSLEVIQRLARGASPEGLTSSPLRGNEVSRPGFQSTLDQFEAAGCLELSQGRLHFTSAEHRVYCAGGWLTVYIEAQLRELTSPLTLFDACHGLQLELAAPHFFERELPLTTILGGQLCLFFCVSSARADLRALLSELSALKRHLGALMIILSLDTLEPEIRNELHALDLELCEGLDELKHFKRWISSRFDLSL